MYYFLFTGNQLTASATQIATDLLGVSPGILAISVAVKSWCNYFYAMSFMVTLVNSENCGVRYEDNGVRACNANNEFHAVTCYDNHTIEIQPCYCMYYNADMNMSVVGNCFFSCYQYNNTLIEVTSSKEFNTNICNKYGSIAIHRMGHFCGRCNSTYGLAAYSYQMISCIPCEDYGYKNWLKYFAVALLPLTVFYVVAVLLSFNVTSSSLSGIILVIQCMSSPPQMNIIASSPYVSRFDAIAKTLASILCITNLDFFRLIYSPFCLHPEISAFEIASLDYMVAVYPIFLIFVTYVVVTAYDREYRILVYIWRPFIAIAVPGTFEPH